MLDTFLRGFVKQGCSQVHMKWAIPWDYGIAHLELLMSSCFLSDGSGDRRRNIASRVQQSIRLQLYEEENITLPIYVYRLRCA